MTKQDLLDKLRNLERDHGYDYERSHTAADALLLDYINDQEISEAFNALERWYA